MGQAVKFCKKILPKVSRSFALTIPMLDDDIYLPVLITYLQDRLLDNFEDEISGEDISLSERKELMDEVVNLFDPENKYPEKTVNKLKGYANLMPGKDLRDLTAGCGILREAYNQLDEEVQKASYKWLREMKEGMQKFLQNEVKTFADLDEYCYYVAGTVGGFLTDVILIKRDLDEAQAGRLKENFNDAGLFLQKVNITRDIKRDLENRDKHFWPLESLNVSREMLLDTTYKEKSMQALERMIKDVKRHISPLVSYYEALPDDLPGYKRFFSVNNALGLATLRKLEGNPRAFYGRKKVKVSKLELAKILQSPEKAFYHQAGLFKHV